MDQDAEKPETIERKTDGVDNYETRTAFTLQGMKVKNMNGGDRGAGTNRILSEISEYAPALRRYTKVIWLC